MKTVGCWNKELLHTFAYGIVLLDKTAKANAIKGMASMRSYFYWMDAVLQRVEVRMPIMRNGGNLYLHCNKHGLFKYSDWLNQRLDSKSH